MTRRETRESAFILLFESLFRDDSPDEIIELASEIDDFKVNDGIKKMFKETLEHSAETDEIISKLSEKRQIERIPKVSLAILRLALYEIIFDENVPQDAAINEAVLLSKKFAQAEDVSFINGVLGKYSRSKPE
ncbi:MAG: transcription antitermination factor NusB [Oscillospiraceae bacterium]